MNVIVCLDDNKGMLFNRRRQSRDQIMLEDMIALVEKEGAKLWIAPFSEKLVKPYREKCPFITVEEAYLEKAEAQDFCFVEDRGLQSRIGAVDRIIVYWWNRVYPADTYLDIDLGSWNREEQKEMEGSSHEKITREVYRK